MYKHRYLGTSNVIASYKGRQCARTAALSVMFTRIARSDTMKIDIPITVRASV